jgi:ABC-type dipeptide/oligopeptide/nickel transport system ATPase component
VSAPLPVPGQAERGEPVLRVRNLRVHYNTPAGAVIAVNGIDLQVRRGETVGLVGESGSGKSTVAMAILRLLQPPGRVVGGEVRILGTDMLGLSERHLQKVLWKQVSLIPQGSMNSLNPLMRVKHQIADAITAHEGRQPAAALKERILGLLEMVQLPRRVYDLYPHELSGGMKQRVCIAMAIALNPPLLIADEPTSALDVVVQRVVAQTLGEVKRRLGMSMLLIGHDMGLQAQMVDRIAVMYAGNIVEVARVKEIFTDPLHSYTRRLIASIPTIKVRKPLVYTDEMTPDLRIPRESPPLRELKPDHFVAISAAAG